MASPKVQEDSNKLKNTLTPNQDEAPTNLRLAPAEEKELINRSDDLKASANKLFTSAEYSDAITGYNRAIDTLPSYLDYELAVLRSNIAACHLKLEEWKEAVDAATRALESLENIDPVAVVKGEDKDGKRSEQAEDSAGAATAVVQEIDDSMAERIETLERSGKSLEDVRKIRIKALLRRAKARDSQGGWANLQGALEDYQQLSSMPQLSPLDRRAAQVALKTLPGKLEQSKKEEMADMMGKLKQLGNGILKPFGLSTDNFNMVKDEASGGYSLNFNQGGGK